MSFMAVLVFKTKLIIITIVMKKTTIIIMVIFNNNNKILINHWIKKENYNLAYHHKNPNLILLNKVLLKVVLVF